MSTVIYKPRPEKWRGAYYPGLPHSQLTKEELVQLARAHGYRIKLVLSLYSRKEEEKIEDASNPSA
jgi:hypothetical protein